jgi:hypothetical protein
MTLLIMQSAAALIAAVFGVKFAVGVWGAIMLRGVWLTPLQPSHAPALLREVEGE